MRMNKTAKPRRLSSSDDAHSCGSRGKKFVAVNRTIDVLRAAVTAMAAVTRIAARTHLVKSNNRCQLLFRTRNSESAIGHAAGQPDKAEYTVQFSRNECVANGVDFFCAWVTGTRRESH